MSMSRHRAVIRFQRLIVGLWLGRRRLGTAFAFTLLATCGSSESAPVTIPETHREADRTDRTECAQTQSDILDTWLPPVVQKVSKSGSKAAATSWEASLWLPEFHANKAGRCHFSNASGWLSFRGTANEPAVFVMLHNRLPPGSHHHRLDMSSATLSAPGASPLRFTKTQMDDFPPYEFVQGAHKYILSFPPIETTWHQLDLHVPFEGTTSSLLVRFERKALASEPE